MLTEVLKVLGLMAMAMVKLQTSPIIILAAGYSSIQTMAITISGGCLGIIVFFFFGVKIFDWWDRMFPPKNRRVMSKKNRTIVRLKNKLGIWGVGLSIAILGIPIASLLAAKYFRHEPFKVILAFNACLIFWTIILTYFSAPIINLF